MQISIIIPTLNEEQQIGRILYYLFNTCLIEESCELIVVDANSKDKTVSNCDMFGVKTIISERKGRSIQMNLAAKVATGDVLYFLHADSLPPTTFVNDIIQSVQADNHLGCFRMKFDLNHWFLKLNSWFTRFNYNRFRFGDQSLYITKELFDKIGGFNENLSIMEDQDIIIRASKKSRFKVIANEITTSARKYVINGVYRLQMIFFYIYILYELGYSQERLVTIYRRLILQPKI
ncbi:TIGR04283 family arsenosugar biosynthesis glycosyltransferase [bacterium AH-315-C07]|nr:TIGR04283 family arsenosugar biosynthesis glycosyltransferase [bacterium AH-315-C07]